MAAATPMSYPMGESYPIGQAQGAPPSYPMGTATPLEAQQQQQQVHASMYRQQASPWGQAHPAAQHPPQNGAQAALAAMGYPNAAAAAASPNAMGMQSAWSQMQPPY